MVTSVQAMQPGDMQITGRLCPWLTFEETQKLRNRYPTLLFNNMGRLYRCKTLKPEEVNIYSMSSVNTHVTFLNTHRTTVSLLTKDKCLSSIEQEKESELLLLPKGNIYLNYCYNSF